MALPILALAAIGAVAASPQLIGAYFENKSLKAQASYTKRVAAINARALRDEAEARRISRGQMEEAERDMGRRRIAAMEAGYAKAGVLMEGTPSLLIASQAGMDERAILQRNQDALYERDNLRVQATNIKREASNVASAMRQQGRNAIMGGILGVAKGAAAGAAGGFAGTPGGQSFLTGQPAAEGAKFSIQDALAGYSIASSLLGGR